MAEEKKEKFISANDQCIGCGACASICPVGAIELNGGIARIDTQKCIKCGACKNFCPMQAIDPFQK